MSPVPETRTPNDVAILWRLAGYGWQHRGRWFLLIGATVGLAILSGSLFFFLKLLLDALTGHVDELNGKLAWFGVAPLAVDQAGQAMVHLGRAMLVVAPVTAALAYIAWHAGGWLANRCVQDLRGQFIGHLIGLDLAFHGSLSRGDLLTRLTSDVQSMQGLFAALFGKVMQRPAVSLGTIAWLFVINWRFAAIVFLLLLPLAAGIARLLRKTRRRAHTARERLADNVSVLEQITAGIRVIKAMGSAAAERTRYAVANRSLFDANLRLVRARAQTDAITNGTIFAVTGLALIAGAWFIGARLITISEFIVFVGALGQLTSQVRSGSRSWGEIQENLPAAVRVFAVLDRPSAISDRPDARDCPEPKRAIRLEGVRFRYAAGSDDVLNGIDLEIPIGSVVALVGEAGAGKSTVLDLIPRFRDATGGTVTWDGVDVRDWRQDSLVHHCAVVQQDSYLFNDTVESNIRYGRPAATVADVEQAARRAHVHDAILGLAGGSGYATVVGDRGERLSGGQRQRVAIARALLRDAPILLLDEPTSALDAENERHVQDALAELMRGRTTIIVAHRLATIQHADVIYVLGDGRVIEQGTHRSLVERGGQYARLVALQRLA